MTKVILEEICNIANIYNANPKEILSVYHRAIKKEYITDWPQAIMLIERYIRIHNGLRKQNPKYSVNVIYDITRKWKSKLTF